MDLIVIALAHLTTLWILAALAQFLFLRLIGVPVTKVQLFHGKTPVRFDVRGCEVAFGWIPVGSTITYDVAEFFRIPPVVRLIGHFSSSVVALISAVVALGGLQGWSQFTAGFGQITLGTWSPLDRATEFLAQWHQIAEESPITGFGILAAKMAAFSIFPLGGVVITQILVDAEASTGRERIGKLAVFNALASMIITILWVFAAIWLLVNK